MKWNRAAVSVLKEKAYAIPDERIPEKISLLDVHLDNYDNLLLSYRHKHERGEVERLANEISRMLEASRAA